MKAHEFVEAGIRRGAGIGAFGVMEVAMGLHEVARLAGLNAPYAVLPVSTLGVSLSRIAGTTGTSLTPELPVGLPRVASLMNTEKSFSGQQG